MKTKKLLITSLFLLLIAGTINLVHAGISVTITEVEITVDNPGDTATYTVNVESITTEAENLQLSIIAHEDLDMNWTFTESVIGVGATLAFGIEANYTGTATGNLPFTVFGEAWPTTYNYSQAVNLGLLETSSYTAYVYSSYVAPEPTPPEPSPSPTPTSGSTPTPIPTDTPSATSSPTPIPTDTPSPAPSTSPSSSPTPPPEETPITLYIAIGIVGIVVAIIVVLVFVRFRK